MKMVKSLILGTAVAFAATAAAQAADLPVKAKAVSYVKICPQYGPGFYYIPGTDICLKVGGSAFFETGYNQAGAAPFRNWGANGFENTDNYYSSRSRIYWNMDARNNSPYGTVRAVLVGGVDFNTGANGASGNQTAAHIQWAYFQFAGFTFGMATSFFDFAPNYMVIANGSTPWGWNQVLGYTAQLGNGLSATIAMEDPTSTNVGRQINGGAITTFGYERPDVVGNVRLDQAWGSAQIMGAVKELRVVNTLAQSDENGYAIGAGISINLPMLAAGDQVQFTAVTSRGAVEYTGLGHNPLTVTGIIGLSGTAPANFGSTVQVTDANVTAGGIIRTEASSFALQFRHYWTPTLRSAFHVGYTEAYNLSSFGGLQLTQYGHSLIWTPMAGLNFSLDVLYTETDVNNVSSDIVSALFRARRDF